MKVFYIFTLLSLWVVGINALLQKRMTPTQIDDAIAAAIEKLGIAEPPVGYWKLIYYAVDDQLDSLGNIVKAGHHWIVAEPLTGPGGVFDGTAYLKLHLSAIEGETGHIVIFTKITVANNISSVLATGAKIKAVGETNRPIPMTDLGVSMGAVDDARFQDGKAYSEFNLDANCQGFSECQFRKLASQYFETSGVNC